MVGCNYGTNIVTVTGKQEQVLRQRCDGNWAANRIVDSTFLSWDLRIDALVTLTLLVENWIIIDSKLHLIQVSKVGKSQYQHVHSPSPKETLSRVRFQTV